MPVLEEQNLYLSSRNIKNFMICQCWRSKIYIFHKNSCRALQDEFALSYHGVRWLCFLAVIFVVNI